MADAPKIKLMYFNFNFWRAEVPRVAMFMGGVEFEDKRLTGDEYKAMKKEGTLAFDQLPVMEYNGKQVAQTGGLCRIAGKLSKMYPEDVFYAAKVDEVIDFCTDITMKVGKTFGSKNLKEDRAELGSETLPKMFGKLENLIKANDGDCFVGKELTVADLAVWRLYGWLSSGKLDHLDITEVDKAAPTVLELVKKVDSNEKVMQWKAKFPSKYNFYKLYYWTGCKEFWGRAIGVVATLNAAGVSYTMHTPDQAEEGKGFAWPQVKLPNGQQIGQTPAILTVLGQKFGLSGKTVEEQNLCQQYLHDMDDLFNETVGGKFEGDKGEKRKAKWFDLLESRLGAQKFMISDEPTVADFHGVFTFEWVFKKCGEKALEGHPKLAQWWKDIREVDAVSKMVNDPNVKMIP